MTQKEQKNQIKNLLACAERLLCCMTEVQQDMDEAAKSIKQQKLLSDEIASKLENKLKELREETKNYTDICGETGIKLACACIKRGRIFLEDPVKTIASIKKETFRSDGTAFWPDISEKQIAERMWEAQIKVVFPIIEKQRSIIVERYRKGIEALLPITGAYGEMFFDAEDVEIGVLSHLVSLGRLVVAFEDGKMIARLRNARNTLAHIKPMTQTEIDEIL